MVNVDTVYKTVLYILNKEQRGYITPDEFNKLGTQVQLEIFEQYFEELNQQLRIPQTDNEYANRIKNLEEKIDVFKTFSNNITYNNTTTPSTPYFELPEKLHRLGTLIYNEKEIQGVNRNEYFLINKSPLTKPTESNPLYVLEGTGSPSAAPSQVYIYPDSIIALVDAYYIKAPTPPQWGYKVNGVGAYEYNSKEKQYGLSGDLWQQYPSLPYPTNALDAGVYTRTVGTFSAITDGQGVQAELEITVEPDISGTNIVTSIVVNPSNSGKCFQIGDTIDIQLPSSGGTGTVTLSIQLIASNMEAGITYSTNFELHPSEQTNIILNILMYSGVIIRDPQVVQTAARMVQQDEALEKQ